MKVQVFKGAGFLQSDMKFEDRSSDFTFYPLVTEPVHSYAISTPRGTYSPAAVSAHWTYRTHCHLCPTRYSFSPESSEAFEGEVSYPRTHHLNNVPRLRGKKHVPSGTRNRTAGSDIGRAPRSNHSNELERADQDNYDDFQLNRTRWFPWIIKKYFSALRDVAPKTPFKSWDTATLRAPLPPIKINNKTN